MCWYSLACLLSLLSTYAVTHEHTRALFEVKVLSAPRNQTDQHKVLKITILVMRLTQIPSFTSECNFMSLRKFKLQA